jgi:hypothetical protein
MELHEWFALALRHSGINQTEMARRLTERLGRSIDKNAVSRMLKGEPPPKGRRIGGDEVLAIEEITDYPAPPQHPGGLRPAG